MMAGQDQQCRLIRLISARYSVMEWRVTPNLALPFCTIGMATARGFCQNSATHLGSPPRRAPAGLTRKNARTKRKMKAYPSDLRRFVQSKDLHQDWPD